jgi:hypothetical protein
MYVGRKWAKDMEAERDPQRSESNCGKLAAILQETAPLWHRSMSNRTLLFTCLGGLLGTWVILNQGGCTGRLADVDRRVDRVLAQRSERLGGGAVVPTKTWTERELPSHRSLATRQPESTNPGAAELNFSAAAEGRDFAARLAELQRQTEGVDDPATRRLDLPMCWRQSQETAREYLSAEEDYILAGIRLLIEEHRWSPRLFASSSVNFDSAQVGPPVTNTLRVMNQAGVRKRLPFGGEVEARWVWEASENLRNAARRGSTPTARTWS